MGNMDTSETVLENDFVIIKYPTGNIDDIRIKFNQTIKYIRNLVQNPTFGVCPSAWCVVFFDTNNFVNKD